MNDTFSVGNMYVVYVPSKIIKYLGFQTSDLFRMSPDKKWRFSERTMPFLASALFFLGGLTEYCGDLHTKVCVT